MVRGVIFDLDGTLFDSDYDWAAIRLRLGVADGGGTILERLESLPPAERRDRLVQLEAIEDQATDAGRLMPGATELLSFLRDRRFKLALVTNNRRDNAERVVERYGLPFDTVLAREDGPAKPAAALLLLASQRLGLPPDQLASVGDNLLDRRAATEAGIGTVITVGLDAGRFAGSCRHLARDLAEVQSMFHELVR